MVARGDAQHHHHSVAASTKFRLADSPGRFALVAWLRRVMKKWNRSLTKKEWTVR